MPFDATTPCPLLRPTSYARLTAQQVFDRAVNGILAQGEPARSQEGGCTLLNPAGLRCAVGHVLDLADLQINVGSLESLLARSPAPRRRSLNALLRRHAGLLTDLMHAHDSAAQSAQFLPRFRDAVRQVALKRQLKSHI